MKLFFKSLYLILRCKLFGVNAHFLKCDTKGCLHVEMHDKLVKEMVGKPCPQCGSNLLTEDDWLDFVIEILEQDKTTI